MDTLKKLMDQNLNLNQTFYLVNQKKKKNLKKMVALKQFK